MLHTYYSFEDLFNMVFYFNFYSVLKKNEVINSRFYGFNFILEYTVSLCYRVIKFLANVNIFI